MTGHSTTWIHYDHWSRRTNSDQTNSKEIKSNSAIIGYAQSLVTSHVVKSLHQLNRWTCRKLLHIWENSRRNQHWNLETKYIQDPGSSHTKQPTTWIYCDHWSRRTNSEQINLKEIIDKTTVNLPARPYQVNRLSLPVFLVLANLHILRCLSFLAYLQLQCCISAVQNYCTPIQVRTTAPWASPTKILTLCTRPIDYPNCLGCHFPLPEGMANRPARPALHIYTHAKRKDIKTLLRLVYYFAPILSPGQSYKVQFPS